MFMLNKIPTILAAYEPHVTQKKIVTHLPTDSVEQGN